MSGRVALRKAPAEPQSPIERGHPERTRVGLMALPMIALVTVLTCLSFQMRSTHYPVMGLGLFSGLLTMLPLILDQSRPPQQRHVFLTLISLSWGAFFALPIFSYYLPNGGYTPSDNSTVRAMHPNDLLVGQLVVLVAYLMMIFGYANPLPKVVTQALPKPRRDWPLATGLAISVTLIPFGWFIYLAGQFGLLPERAGSGVLGVLAGSTIFGIALLALLYMRFGSRISYLMLCIATPMTMLFNFFTGSKGLFFAPIAMIMLTYAVERRRFRVRWFVGAIIAFSLFYPVAQFYREVVMEENTRKAADVLSDPGRAFRSMRNFMKDAEVTTYAGAGLQMTAVRFDGMGMAAKIVRDTPSRVPYQQGWTIGYIFLSYIPRIFWPGKPEITIGQWVTDNYIAPGIRSNTGPSWVGEYYFNFGIGGVIIGMFLLGFYFRMLHETVFRSGAPVPATWFAVIVIYQVVPNLGGGLVAPINVLGFYGGLVLLIHLATRFTGTDAPAGSLSAPAARSTAPTRAAGARGRFG